MKATKSGTIRFFEPMYALAVQNIPEGKEWLYEVKFDGYRCLVGRDKGGVRSDRIGDYLRVGTYKTELDESRKKLDSAWTNCRNR